MSLDNISSMRLWIYRCIAILVIPFVFILCLEGGLRLFAVGHPVDLISECSVDGQDYYCENTRFIEQFFPKDIARQPVSFAYPAQKSENTFRIFILGASAAQGDPEPSYGFSRILQVLLRERFPEINFEIINPAISATNSHVVLPVAKELSHHQPDMAIVYLGNNEVVGPFGSGTIFGKMSPNLTLIRAGIQLKATRTGQVIETLINKVKGTKNPGKWRGMEMFLDSQFRSDAVELETVYSHYQNNLSEIIKAFSERGVPVIVSTVGSNLKDFPPLASLHDPSLPAEEIKLWEEAYRNGRKRFNAGEIKAALSDFLIAEQIDGSYADLQFFLGQTYLGSGQLKEAKDHFVLARDLDTLRFRADSRINNIIRAVTNENADSEVLLIDTDQLFNEQSPQGIQGNELFYEHVHMTFHGNYLLAREIADKVLPFSADDTMAKSNETNFLNEQDCFRMLALSRFDQLRNDKLVLGRMSSPPFSNQLNHAERLSRLETNYDLLARALTPEEIEASDRLYRQAVQAAKSDPYLRINYGVFLKAQKKTTAAINQLQIAVKLLPKSYKVHNQLAQSLAESTRFQESIVHYDAAIKLTQVMEDRTKLRMLKAYALARLERYEECMHAYEETLAEDSVSAVSTYHAMAKLKIKTGPLAEAGKLLEKAIAANNGEGGIPDIYFNYGYVLNQLKQRDQAISAYKTAIDAYKSELKSGTDQDRKTLLYVLGRGYFEIGEIEEGSNYLQQAINESPENLTYHLTLITALARNGQTREALVFTDQALMAMTEFNKSGAIAKLENIKSQIAKTK